MRRPVLSRCGGAVLDDRLRHEVIDRKLPMTGVGKALPDWRWQSVQLQV